MVLSISEIKKKYQQNRKTEIITEKDIAPLEVAPTVESYKCKIYFTDKGYFKKVKLTSLRMNDDHSLRDGDSIISEEESDNTELLLFFTDKGQVYKSSVANFEPTKASSMGDYVPSKLGFEENEKVVAAVSYREEDEGNIVFVFKNGKGVKVPLDCYKTKTNRRKLTSAFSTASECVFAALEKQEVNILMVSENGRALLVSSSDIPLKTTRTSAGVTLMTLKAKNHLERAETVDGERIKELKKYKKNLPSSGAAYTKE